VSSIIYIDYFKTPFGELILGAFEGKLCLADWRYRKMRSAIDKRIQTGLNASFVEQSDPIITKAKEQLDTYFLGSLKTFDLPLLFVGSDFQKKVWEALEQIPYGKTISYLELSRDLGDEKAIRAVATANGANAISIVVPCHRIIGSDGSLVGYAGGLAAKKKLLKLEGADAVAQTELF
jgi:methylated-DNA-[protein]-cysteine S-methyltransferase